MFILQSEELVRSGGQSIAGATDVSQHIALVPGAGSLHVHPVGPSCSRAAQGDSMQMLPRF